MDILEQFISKGQNRAEEYREVIEDMLGKHSRYGYAERTLVGILDYIEEEKNITDKQVEAIENIKNNPNKRNVW